MLDYLTSFFIREVKHPDEEILLKCEKEADQLIANNKIKEAIDKYFDIIKRRNYQGTKRLEKKIYKLCCISDADFQLNLLAANHFRRMLVTDYLKKDLNNKKALEINNFNSTDIQDISKFRLQLTVARFNQLYIEKDNEVIKKQLESVEKGFTFSLMEYYCKPIIPKGVKENRTLTFGSFTMGISCYQGPDKQKEDFTVTGAFDCQFVEGNKKVIYAAVLDGHGGKECAEFYVRKFENSLFNLLTGISYKEEWKMNWAINKLIYDLEKAWRKEKNESGSTIAAALFIEGTNEGWYFNLGDTRIILCTNGNPILLTEDVSIHNKKCVTETLDRGSALLTIKDEVEPRFYGMLEMSESLGDFYLRSDDDKSLPYKLPGNSSKPHIVRKKCEDNQYVIILTDGVWNFMNTRTVCEAVQTYTYKGLTLGKMTKNIVQEAYNRGSSDDATVLMIKSGVLDD